MAVFSSLKSDLQKISHEVHQIQEDHLISSLNSHALKISGSPTSKKVCLSAAKLVSNLSKEAVYQVAWCGVNLLKVPVLMFSNLTINSTCLYKKAEIKLYKANKLAHQSLKLSKQIEYLINHSQQPEQQEKLRGMLDDLFDVSIRIVGSSNHVQSSLHNNSVVKWKANQLHRDSMNAEIRLIDLVSGVKAKHELATQESHLEESSTKGVKSLAELSAIALLNTSNFTQGIQEIEAAEHLEMADIQNQLESLNNQFNAIDSEINYNLNKALDAAMRDSQQRQRDFPRLP